MAGARLTVEGHALPPGGRGGRCPRCGAATLFDGIVRLAPRCRACGLDFQAFNVGDGPAAFLTLGVGGLIVAMAVTTELVLSPPVWLHILLWPPITILAVVGSLRLSKALLIGLEYRHQAGEGRQGDSER